MYKNDIVARLITSKKEREVVFRHRHEIFTRELNWVGSEIHETDKYDEFSDFLGVFWDNELVAHTRITDYTHPWMMETVFRHLLSEDIKKTPDSLESTRLFVPKKFRKRQKLNDKYFFVTELLQYAGCKYCQMRSRNLVYGVFLMTVFRLLKLQGMPIKHIGSYPEPLSKKAVVPTVIDWGKLDPDKFYRQELLDLVRIEINPLEFAS